jgi:hypothetical protein
LATKDELKNAGARIVYDETELKTISFDELIAVVKKILPQFKV